VNETVPEMRKDLDFVPIQYQGRQMVLIRDHLGLVPDGRAIEFPLYEFMTLLDGKRDIRDLQMALMRSRGGMLVDTDEVKRLLAHLDESFLLDSETFRKARDQMVKDFASRNVRPCSHCGRSYPGDRFELEKRLEEIVGSHEPVAPPDGKIVALVSPHIDLSVGLKAYSCSYQLLRYVSPSRVLLLGVGHQMAGDLFSITDKDFETPLGVVGSDRECVKMLCDAGSGIIAGNDFAHRSEHSIEFQILFLQHMLPASSFKIVPILSGFIKACIPAYTREAYLKKAGPLLKVLNEIISQEQETTLIVAGVDFSHVGPKFGHDSPARYLSAQSEAHDKNLLDHLVGLDADRFWEESIRVEDRFNVCGFSALACFLEILPQSRGKVLHYETWYEEPTKSAVSFASAVFTRQ